MIEELICLACPACRSDILRPLQWFKQTYATCPACGGGVAATQFAALVEALEASMDEGTDAMVLGKSACSGGCGGGCR